MKADQLFRDILALPLEGQQQVGALIAALKKQYPTADDAQPQSPLPLLEEPFVGIWANREELADSSQWVRETRSRQWREEPINRGDY